MEKDPVGSFFILYGLRFRIGIQPFRPALLLRTDGIRIEIYCGARRQFSVYPCASLHGDRGLGQQSSLELRGRSKVRGCERRPVDILGKCAARQNNLHPSTQAEALRDLEDPDIIRSARKRESRRDDYTRAPLICGGA